MALFLDVGPEDVLRIGDTYLTIERKSGSRARLRIAGGSEVELLKKAALQDAPPPMRVAVAQNTGD